MAFHLPVLPFDPNSLAPHISAESLSFHYNKHHKAYVEKTNRLLQRTFLRDSSLEEVVRESSGDLFNNSAQAWNHTFYWHCLSPRTIDHKPSGELTSAIKSGFGSKEELVGKFLERAEENFGSGWTWLVRDWEGELSLLNTSNAATPLTGTYVPLLAIDIWEHAYYIDYRNDRSKYLEAIRALLNWKFASQCYDADAAFNATREMSGRRAA